MPTIPQFPPSPLATALIAPTTDAKVSAPFTVAPVYANGVPSPIGGPTSVSLTITATGEDEPSSDANARIFKIDSTGRARFVHELWVEQDVLITSPGLYVVVKDDSCQVGAYGVDAHGYSASAQGSA